MQRSKTNTYATTPFAEKNTLPHKQKKRKYRIFFFFYERSMQHSILGRYHRHHNKPKTKVTIFYRDNKKTSSANNREASHSFVSESYDRYIDRNNYEGDRVLPASKNQPHVQRSSALERRHYRRPRTKKRAAALWNTLVICVKSSTLAYARATPDDENEFDLSTGQYVFTDTRPNGEP